MSRNPLKVVLLQETRADKGILTPLIVAMNKDGRFELNVICNSGGVLTGDDWLIVLGDRREMLEATIKAAYAGIPVAHIQGGDRSGTIDEPCRHAITRFVNLHFPCTEQSAKRLALMGEEPWRIQVCGPLGIYAMRDASLDSKAKLCADLGLQDGREIILVLQHPVSTQQAQAGDQMQATLDAVKGWQTVVIYPNSDPGSAAMVQCIESCNWVHKFKNLPYLQFIALLKACNVIVGNSSTGLYEAPLFGVPCVNIGNRQQDRERANYQTIWAPHESIEVHNAVIRQLRFSKWTGENPFKVLRDGPKVIMDTLWNTEINERLLQKRLTY